MPASKPLPNASARRWTRLLRAALICAICAWATTSCATGATATRDAPPLPPSPPPPPALQANQRQPCPELPAPTSDTALALIDNHDRVAGLYHECAARTASLVQAMDAWEALARQWYCRAVTASGLTPTGCGVRAEGRR